MPNKMTEAKSPYLRKAAGQPVDWVEWGDEAFDQAKKRDLGVRYRTTKVTDMTFEPGTSFTDLLRSAIDAAT